MNMPVCTKCVPPKYLPTPSYGIYHEAVFGVEPNFKIDSHEIRYQCMSIGMGTKLKTSSNGLDDDQQ